MSGIVFLGLAACADTALRYPPTSLHAVELMRVDEGTVAVSAGATLLGGTNDLYGGSPDLSLGVGLPAGLELRFTGAEMQDAWKGTGTLSWTHHPTARYDWGLTGGLALSRHHVSGTVGEEIVVSETSATSGTSFTTSTSTTSGTPADTYDFTYWNPTVFFGVKTSWRASKWFGFGAGARYARSMVADAKGDIAGDVTTPWNYIDFGGGPVAMLGPLRIGVDIGGLMFLSNTGGAPTVVPRIGFGLRGDIPTWTPRSDAGAAVP